MAEAMSCEDPNPSHLSFGMADVMNKILKTRKPRRKKTIVLAKAKKLSSKQITNAKDEPFENDPSVNKMKNSDWILKGRMKPNPLDRNTERRLLKITTSGVVNLFNAVNKCKNGFSKSDSLLNKDHLKSIDKSKFLGLLSSGPSTLNKENSEHGLVEGDKTEKDHDISETWDVLRKDFGNSTKWKNWDKTLLDRK